MNFGSVCSGIEAASVAWAPLGWKASWFSEIEPFPSAVLAVRFPETPNLGDMRTLPERILSGEVSAPDILCGGTPCQAFSYAGKRRSLDDERGNLSLIFCKVVDAIDSVRAIHGQRPCVVFWENVPGVLNTKDNAFGCFLGGVIGSDTPLSPGAGKWPSAGMASGTKRKVAWRVLDAQYFGVPQRRRRVFVVASAREGFDSSKVLFERQGVRRDSETSGSQREGIATFSESSFGTFKESVVGGTLKACGGFFGGCDENLVVYDMTHACDVIRASKTAPTLQARMGTGGNQVPLVISQGQSGAISISQNITPTLRTEVKASSRSTPLILSENGTGSSVGIGLAPPIKTTTPSICCYPLDMMKVRRLTPVECERLQGFPDDWTRIPWRGKPAESCPDAPRYKAIGNSWAVPCARWIGRRIKDELEKDL